jgi:hypothetical protein
MTAGDLIAVLLQSHLGAGIDTTGAGGLLAQEGNRINAKPLAYKVNTKATDFLIKG